MRKGQTAMEYLMTYGWAILIIMVVVAVLFYLGVFNIGNTISQCSFPPGFTCVTSKLKAGTAQLYLKIGQGTGHNIMINGINCTQQTDISAMTKAVYVDYDNYALAAAGCATCNNINMSSGSSAVIADAVGVSAISSGVPANASNIICSLSNGTKSGDTGIGSTYNGKIYINYTELDTGLPRFIAGTFTAKYEA